MSGCITEGEQLMPSQFCIVTPSYNQACFLRAALLSVARQQPAVSVQHIVADGGSSDGSPGIIADHGAAIAKWRSEPDRGQTAALNWGFQYCGAEYCGWLNSDDYYLPGALSAVAERFEAPDRPDVVFGYSVNVDERGHPLRENRCDDLSMAMLSNVAFDFSQPSLFWRSRWNASVFPLDESLRFCMDVALVSRLALAGARFARVPAFLSAFRVHGRSKSSTIAQVGRSEYEAIAARLRAGASSGSHLPLVLQLRRRVRMLARGECRYALLGGRLGMSPGVRRAATDAALWLAE